MIISLSEARVEMSTHRSYSGRPVPSMIPGISLNCLRTSSIIWEAALPTAWIVMALNTKGSIPPIKRPTITRGLFMSITESPTDVAYAAKRARAVRAAEPIARPLPMAAVVLPTASSLSVIFLTSGGMWLISAIPPALSAMGP